MEQEQEKLTFEEVFEQVAKWQKETFGEGNPVGILNHLKRETDELIEETEKDVLAFGVGMALPNSKRELADHFILLINYCHTQKISIFELPYLILHKLQENKMRQWNKPDKEGVITHVKDGKDN